MKKQIIISLFLTMASICYAQKADSIAFLQKNQETGIATDGSLLKYRRSSLYSVIIEHPTFPYGEQIDSAFFAMPMPDKFNDHNLGERVIISNAVKMKKGGKKKASSNEDDINAFISDNAVARNLVAKWFDRDTVTGAFDMNLIQERGFYDASQIDIAAAESSARNVSMLGDAGEELIGKTFMIVNDITFADKGEKSAKAAGVFATLGKIASTATGNDNYAQLGNVTATAVNEIDGFSVNITSYLYRLVWNDETMGTFYSQYWYDKDNIDTERKALFDNSDIFKLEYVGSTTTSASNVASKSFSKKSKGEQMLKVCARAVDKSIVELQREYEEFKVNIPITVINQEEKTVEVPIGLKEGLNENSVYEVLMKVEDENGHVEYKKVGTIKPVEGKIWDNRYGALDDVDEGEKDNDGGDPSLKASTFKIVSGANQIVLGCLAREMKIK